MAHHMKYIGSLQALATAGALIGGCLCGTQMAHAQNTGTIFGPNVYVFDPSTNGNALATALNNLNQASQFDATHRYAVLFKPGTYNFGTQTSGGTTSNQYISTEGFYEQIAGLGTSPDQVVVQGNFDVGQEYASNNTAGTDNFWRSQENMQVNPNGEGYWGVAQGASYRRMHVVGNLQLTNYECGYSSGGFIADTFITGQEYSCSEQQYYTRNTQMGSWKGNNWNMVFSGDTGGVPAQDFGNGGNSYTVLSTTPQSREKPFLYLDSSGNYEMFVPSLRANSSGYDWANGLPAGTSMPMSDFFIANPSSSITSINNALAAGQSLILTPGIYNLAGTINVTKANTVVYGMGYATLIPTGAFPAISTADVDGVILAGLLVDAGPNTTNDTLVEVGGTAGSTVSHSTNPQMLDDVFIRIGGADTGAAQTSIQIDANNTIMDNIWAWRADHGTDASWTGNTAAHGLVVNGNNVLATGLAVEHYQQSQVVWKGAGGETIFYQSELPYDPPSQSAWMDGSARGYPSYEVDACTHTAYGLGIYSYFSQGVSIYDDNAITTPNTTGIDMTDMVTVFLAGSGGIADIINGTGGSVQSGAAPDYLKSYVGSGACPTQQSSGVYINAGGGAVGNFVADTDYVGGGAGSSTTHAIDTSLIAGTVAPQGVWQSNHDGVITYTIPGLAVGSTHTVQLDFCEVYFNAAGKREFNVAINGASELSNFDIVAAAGAQYKAVAKTFTATAVAGSAGTGQIVISLTSGAVNQPEISGIEIH